MLRPLRLSTLAIVSAIAIVDVNAGTVTGATIAVGTGVIKTPARLARGVDVGRMRTTITTRATSHRDGCNHESIEDGEGGVEGEGVGQLLPPLLMSMVDARPDCFDEVY